MKQGHIWFAKWATLFLGLFLCIPQTALAQTNAVFTYSAPPAPIITKAEKLRRLDIMLMVTGLRCRATPDDFREDFEAFEAAHLDELNGAVRDLRIEITQREGKAGVERTLDRLGVVMANQFGGGHPWLDCHALKELAHGLAMTQGEAVLREAAELAFSEAPKLARAP